MVTQLAAGRVFDYNRSIGRGAVAGAGFSLPVGMCLGQGDLVFVASRGSEYIPGAPWNRIGHGARVGVISIGSEPEDEEWLSEFSRYGDAAGELIWPAGVALDSQGNAYVTDEWLNRVSVFDRDGKYATNWGAEGSGPGQFSGPAGIHIDSQDTVYVVDGRNHRVQKFATDGTYQSEFGGFGSGPGEFDSPWGITLDSQGYVYLADHKNNRVQKLTAEGEFVAQFGSYGANRGQLNRPSDVAVDPDGDVYVCDWGNDRVQVFAPEGRFLVSLVGDAQELSKWARPVVTANPQIMKRRREVRNIEVEWRLAMPSSVVFDAAKGRLLIADTHRNRIQIYNKVRGYVSAQRNL